MPLQSAGKSGMAQVHQTNHTKLAIADERKIHSQPSQLAMRPAEASMVAVPAWKPARTLAV